MKRLLDDAQFPAELRADLLRSRSAGQDYQTAAKLLQLRASFSDHAAPAALRGSGVGTALKRAAHPGWKLAVLAALGGGATWLARPLPQPPAPAPSVAEQAPPPAAAIPAAAPAIEIEPPPAAAPEPAAAPRRVSNAAPTASSSRREIAQLVRIRALIERDPGAAYRLAQRSQREFPRGVLSEERQALAIVALVNNGAKDSAHLNARQFFAHYPQSPMRKAIETALRR